ncbi:MAG: hypothetical protein LBN22_02095 [Clostridiales Family XIII bacterium]|jgi:YbbR domain-containing protein|nr:hypothetical protein [Clostridiales Family XIII bacterium]
MACLKGMQADMLSNNKFNIIISVVAAIVIWGYVVLAVNPSTTKTLSNIPIEISGIDDLTNRGLVIASMDTETVTVVAEGTRSDIYEITPMEILAKIDVTGYPQGRNEISLTTTAPDKINIEDTRPEKLSVTIEKLYKDTKPVEVSYKGTMPSGMEPGNVEVLPKNIEIGGTKDAVERVNSVRVDVQVKDDGEAEEHAEVYPVAYDSLGKQVLGISFSQETVAVNFKLMYLKEVDLSVKTKGTPDTGLKVASVDAPNTIWLKSTDKNALNDLDKFISPEDLDVTGLNEKKEFVLKFNLPSGVYIAKSSSGIKATVDFEKDSFVGAASEDPNVSDGAVTTG